MRIPISLFAALLLSGCYTPSILKDYTACKAAERPIEECRAKTGLYGSITGPTDPNFAHNMRRSRYEALGYTPYRFRK
ncbi:hypothetical protein [Nitrosomonas sp.]|uniref:hypothetical protein n=1 Tax=Nitrosomonas sp. TaxID=42353 RepID=UPI0037C912AA